MSGWAAKQKKKQEWAESRMLDGLDGPSEKEIDCTRDAALGKGEEELFEKKLSKEEKKKLAEEKKAARKAEKEKKDAEAGKEKKPAKEKKDDKGKAAKPGGKKVGKKGAEEEGPKGVLEKVAAEMAAGAEKETPADLLAKQARERPRARGAGNRPRRCSPPFALPKHV